jgi:hypothetical protein
VFAIAAETGWPEERILFMPLARLAQYQHCLLLRNGVRTEWSLISQESDAKLTLQRLRAERRLSVGMPLD